ncbi:hypothetical protein BFW38_15580 [Terasakiispira papahanaumokuakeensis]|uniref:Glutamine amidotransferase domain-containing protein n=1 Tax=Terasakiispira papahanaumokuakeensis TaxID=197479 RepID=A0A1E2VCI4_9GAMM|nr:type 1 glutamine amidotransferase [Terasakiispira papahanaumokuakeensis]ODC04738.1 hypothetical protein BFW38_15580 [Terasakiispira papahanaumokuakeensis]
MHIYFLQHSAHDGPARFADWLTSQGHSHNTRQLWAGEPLPDPKEFDALILLSGPMHVHDIDDYPWLKQEKRLIHKLKAGRKPLLGIGLGAQLIAEAFGATISPNPQSQCGWIDIHTTPNDAHELPTHFRALNWHPDQFSLPDNAEPLAYLQPSTVTTAAQPPQGFSLDKGRILGIQFHVESTLNSTQQMLDSNDPRWHLQRETLHYEEIMDSPDQFTHLAAVLDRLLLNWLTPSLPF